jgi:hypothetical protein
MRRWAARNLLELERPMGCQTAVSLPRPRGLRSSPRQTETRWAGVPARVIPGCDVRDSAGIVLKNAQFAIEARSAPAVILIPGNQQQGDTLYMAKSALDGTEWTATEFAGLLPEKQHVARRELACLSCDGPAVFRAGHKRRPSFAARHRHDCQLFATAWSAFVFLAGSKRRVRPARANPVRG